jgi:hypothetical protein
LAKFSCNANGLSTIDSSNGLAIYGDIGAVPRRLMHGLVLFSLVYSRLKAIGDPGF